MQVLIHWMPLLALGGAVLCALKALREFPLGFGAMSAPILIVLAMVMAAWMGAESAVTVRHCLQFFAVLVVVWIPVRFSQP